MDLHEIGAYLHEHAGNRLVDLSLRMLGFTAVALEALLDEVMDEDIAAERWGAYDLEGDELTS